MSRELTAFNEISDTINLKGLDQFLQRAIELGYAFIDYDQVSNSEKFIIMRHDLDVEPKLALQVAELECNHEVQATYYVMLRNPLYNPFSKTYRSLFRHLAELGHRIGLHFDATEYGELAEDAILQAIDSEMCLLRDILHPVRPTRYLSFHKPNPFLLENNYSTENFESSYNDSFFKEIRYISDSGGIWREESIIDLLESGSAPKIQFTTHPVWWVMSGALVQDRLEHAVAYKHNELKSELAQVINDPTRNIVLYNPNHDAQGT